MRTDERRRTGVVLSVLDEHEIRELCDDPGAGGPVVCLWPDGAEVPHRVAAALADAAGRRAVVVLRHGPLRDVLVDCRGETHEVARIDLAACVEDVLRRSDLAPSGLHEERLEALSALHGGDR